ncbi:Serine/threonine-protein phosphatase 2A activator 2 [Malassezia sp. CBS 17886]|nr:Serine/threonine-protein phosphatase 2A activator 2 [Malassezia sp. CBS 17886]
MGDATQSALSSKLQEARTARGPPPPPRPESSADPFEGAAAPVVVGRDLPLPPTLPRKRIVTPADLDHFKHTQAYAEILGIVRAGNDAVKGCKLTDDTPESEPLSAALRMVEAVQQLVAETPRDTDSASTSRFGNPAFRTFYEKVVRATDALLATLPGLGDSDGAPAHQRRLRDEIAVYFYESWGNAKRIDYGSGMELNFLCWLLCLVKVGVLDLRRDAEAMVLRVFWKYVEIMRTIQATYWLEPAGSHGVWGLDDYHFLPFLWGAAQLSEHSFLRPKSIHDREIVDECEPAYMYFSCVQAINAVKTESLRWHSPMLDDISSVRTWGKVNQGMVKMYRAEVLAKLPIAQHMFFGTLVDFGTPPHAEEHVIEEDEHGHLFQAGAGHGPHAHGEGQAAGWGDCCGIPIPSVFAAAEQAGVRGARMAATPIRRVPFD